MCCVTAKGNLNLQGMSSVRLPTRGNDVLWFVEWMGFGTSYGKPWNWSSRSPLDLTNPSYPEGIGSGKVGRYWRHGCTYAVLSGVGRGLAEGRFPVQGVSLSASKRVAHGSMSNTQLDEDDDDFMLQISNFRAFATKISKNERVSFAVCFSVRKTKNLERILTKSAPVGSLLRSVSTFQFSSRSDNNNRNCRD
jgi:hypothetical protein